MSQKSLTSRSIDSFYWIVSRGLLIAALRVLLMSLLARLLLPSDFGIAQAAMVVTGFVSIFSMIGVGPALIQFKVLSKEQVSAAFAFSILLGVILGLLVFYSSGLLSLLFNEEKLETVIKVVSIVFPINAISNVSNNLLKRKMDFKTLSKVELWSFIFGYALIAIILSFFEFGYWALIYATIAHYALQSLCYYILQPHRVSLTFKKSDYLSLLKFGGGITISQLFNYMALKGDYLIVGRYLGNAALGVYGRSYNIMNASVALFGQGLDKLLFSAMSRKQDDSKSIFNAFLVSNALVAFTLIPISIFLVLAANEIILILLGEKWLDAIMPFQILIIGMYFRINYKVSGALLRSFGKVYRIAFIQFLYAVIVIFGSFSLVKVGFGIEGVCVIVVIALIMNYLLLTYAASSIIEEITLLLQLKMFLYPLLSSIIPGLITFYLISYLRINDFHALAILFISGSIFIMSILFLVNALPKLFIAKEFKPALFLLKSRFPNGFNLKNLK